MIFSGRKCEGYGKSDGRSNDCPFFDTRLSRGLGGDTLHFTHCVRSSRYDKRNGGGMTIELGRLRGIFIL